MRPGRLRWFAASWCGQITTEGTGRQVGIDERNERTALIPLPLTDVAECVPVWDHAPHDVHSSRQGLYQDAFSVSKLPTGVTETVPSEKEPSLRGVVLSAAQRQVGRQTIIGQLALLPQNAPIVQLLSRRSASPFCSPRSLVQRSRHVDRATPTTASSRVRRTPEVTGHQEPRRITEYLSGSAA